MGRDRSLRKPACHRGVKRLLLLPPLLKLRIVTRQFQCLGNGGILPVASGAVRDQNPFGFRAGHDVRAADALRSTIIFCIAVMPREMRDFTVPSGTSRIFAISS